MRVVFRTDGGFLQGMGDVWAAIAIAEALPDFAVFEFVVSREEEGCTLLRERGHRVAVAASWEQEQHVYQAAKPDVMVLSRLQNPPATMEQLRATGALLVTLDDAGPGAALADLRINPLYWVEDALTDPHFIMLREEFREAWASPLRINDEVKSVLLMQGGSDTHGFLKKILRALAPLKGEFEVQLLKGPAFAEDEELDREIGIWGDDLRLHANCSRMAALMQSADLAITGAGLTLLECLCVGLPTLTVSAEPWETETAARVARLGATVDMGFGADLDGAALLAEVEAIRSDPLRRHRMAMRGRELVDGRGSERIAAEIEKLWRNHVTRGEVAAPGER
ncbi:hypothetical protein OOT46_02800 [Aquabacterium sp. A7-Y]|uniref:PseG/SpsG family protein n=1 Tax=Aquabacterium sp. A7-Y TaxID=1349605 RepID=UPI00223DB600|nr:hypothetical protein [Aquabacterium sp. A7-Y]MCW7536782.1 hypothetical protein [Aquabacterium sp. A7-Y]